MTIYHCEKHKASEYEDNVGDGSCRRRMLCKYQEAQLTSAGNLSLTGAAGTPTPELPQHARPRSRSLKCQFHVPSRSTLPSSSLGLISIQVSQVLFSTELAIKLACGSGGWSCPYFSKQIKKALKIPSTKKKKN